MVGHLWDMMPAKLESHWNLAAVSLQELQAQPLYRN